MTLRSPGGVLAVHAHPDDESITMAGTLAKYASRGVPVHLVTATMGEHGELMHGRFGGLDADHADQLGGYRFSELQRACRAIGMTSYRFLGGLGRFRDSGMAGEASAENPRAFIRAQRGGPDHEEAVDALVAVLDELQPAVVLTYDSSGGYGHPDHIATHQVTYDAVTRWRRGSTAAAACRLLAVVRPRSVVDAALAALWEHPMPPGYRRPDVGDLGTFVDLSEIAVTVDVSAWRAARRAAMAAHATQLDVWAGPVVDGFALTNLYAQPLLDAEYFTLLAGDKFPASAADIVLEPR